MSNKQNQPPSDFPASPVSKPRPVFIYGTLCAMPLLAWVLTGDALNVSAVSTLTQPAKVYGYARFLVRNCDYPAVVSHDAQTAVDGFLLTFEANSLRKRLDIFEGEAYKPATVAVTLLNADGSPDEETVEADMYLWAGDAHALTAEPWQLDNFVKGRLTDWLNIFDGMELMDDDWE
ncbi:AIG2-like protein [Whalleya microplaca]|nr:AIG2-like protein [Whalleya microplaca]